MPLVDDTVVEAGTLEVASLFEPLGLGVLTSGPVAFEPLRPIALSKESTVEESRVPWLVVVSRLDTVIAVLEVRWSLEVLTICGSVNSIDVKLDLLVAAEIVGSDDVEAGFGNPKEAELLDGASTVKAEPTKVVWLPSSPRPNRPNASAGGKGIGANRTAKKYREGILPKTEISDVDGSGQRR